jgi:hypothetical protein
MRLVILLTLCKAFLTAMLQSSLDDKGGCVLCSPTSRCCSELFRSQIPGTMLIFRNATSLVDPSHNKPDHCYPHGSDAFANSVIFDSACAPHAVLRNQDDQRCFRPSRRSITAAYFPHLRIRRLGDKDHDASRRHWSSHHFGSSAHMKASGSERFCGVALLLSSPVC